MKILKYITIFLLIITFYAITAIPVGLFLYSWKMDLGINIFSSTGFHSYISCLKDEAKKIHEQDFYR